MESAWVLWYIIVTVQSSGFASASHEPQKYEYPSRTACISATQELLGMETRDRYFSPILCLPKSRYEELTKD